MLYDVSVLILYLVMVNVMLLNVLIGVICMMICIMLNIVWRNMLSMLINGVVWGFSCVSVIVSSIEKKMMGNIFLLVNVLMMVFGMMFMKKFIML